MSILFSIPYLMMAIILLGSQYRLFQFKYLAWCILSVLGDILLDNATVGDEESYAINQFITSNQLKILVSDLYKICLNLKPLMLMFS